MKDLLRQLPSVDIVAGRLEPAFPDVPRHVLVEEARRVIGELREAIATGKRTNVPDVERMVADAVRRLTERSLVSVINATGVILHTNLGRAPLPALDPPAGYSNLEYDLATGARGKRDVHIGALLERLLGAPAIAVNNNAAAVYLVLNELAAGREVIVSRGELIEIGDGFRIPDIMARAGVALREVGTTNRTHIEDYRDAINDRTALLLRVHPSNFQIRGFTGRPEVRELAALAHERNLSLYEDLGSGCLVDLRHFGISEPLASESLQAGVDLISFSGDKLLGGPQAGIIAGREDLVRRVRRNPMYRALRLDKLMLHALERTARHLLLERWPEIPVLRMLSETPESLHIRARRMLEEWAHPRAAIVEGESLLGGGSTPEQTLPTWLISLECDDVAERGRLLRHHRPAVIARIEDGCLLFDLRTVAEEEEPLLLSALRKIGGKETATLS